MSEEKDIDKLLKEFNDDAAAAPPVAAPDTGGATEHILTPQSLAHSLASLTQILARKLDMPEVAFTPDDTEDLTNALMPFADKLDLLIKYLPYLPMGIFAAGYGIRVYGGIKRKNAEAKKTKIVNHQDTAAKEAVDKAGAENAASDAANAQKQVSGDIAGSTKPAAN